MFNKVETNKLKQIENGKYFRQGVLVLNTDRIVVVDDGYESIALNKETGLYMSFTAGIRSFSNYKHSIMVLNLIDKGFNVLGNTPIRN